MAAEAARKRQEERDPIALLREEKWLDSEDIRRAMSTVGRPWTRRKARRWLAKSGAGFQVVPRGHWFTTLARLVERFPDVVAAIHQEKMDRAECEDDY